MKAIRSVLLGLALLLVFSLADATAKAPKAKGKKKGAAAAAVGELVPSAILDQLDLTAEQKKQVDQLQDEFAARSKKARLASMAEMKQAKANKDKAAAKKAAASMRLAIDEVRQSMEPQVVKLLTDAQKKKYEELKKDMPVGAGKAGGRFAPSAPETVKGTIQRLDTERGTLVLTAGGKSTTYQVSRATKVLDAAGAELPGGLTDKALAPGAEVALTITVRKAANVTRGTAVVELRLAAK